MGDLNKLLDRLGVTPHDSVVRNIIPIDRSKPFNPATFIGKGWSVWRGLADGYGLEGDEERDSSSTILTELDIDRVQFVTCLKRGESMSTGEERLKRLQADDYVRLDENVFQAFWEKRESLPARFKERPNGNVQLIFFDGVVLRGPDGRRYTLYFYFSDNGSWGWNCRWLDIDRDARHSSAVLATFFISSLLCLVAR